MPDIDHIATRRWCFEQASVVMTGSEARFAVAYAQELFEWITEGKMTEAAKRCLNSRNDAEVLDRLAAARSIVDAERDARYVRYYDKPNSRG